MMPRLSLDGAGASQKPRKPGAPSKEGAPSFTPCLMPADAFSNFAWRFVIPRKQLRERIMPVGLAS
jgi:hypothetical protein